MITPESLLDLFRRVVRAPTPDVVLEAPEGRSENGNVILTVRMVVFEDLAGQRVLRDVKEQEILVVPDGAPATPARLEAYLAGVCARAAVVLGPPERRLDPVPEAGSALPCDFFHASFLTDEALATDAIEASMRDEARWAAIRARELAEALAAVDRALVALSPADHRRLRAPASEADRAPLLAFAASPALRADLAAWFAWHDGQAEDDVHSLFGVDNRVLLSARDALRAHAFLERRVGDVPWSSSWLPLFRNGGGDYVVLETRGPRAGCLIAFWHDDDRRVSSYDGLLHWALEVEEALVAEREAAPVCPFTVPDAPSWEPLAEWTDASATAMPPGALLRLRRTDTDTFSGRTHEWFTVLLKASADVWVQGWGATEADALARLRARSAGLVRESDRDTDRGVRFRVRDVAVATATAPPR